MSDVGFEGPWLNAIDAKGRLLIPSAFRDVITARGGGRQLKISTGFAGRRCLVGYAADYAHSLRQGFDSRHGASIAADATAERADLAGPVTNLGIDDAGRVVLPAGYKRAGGFTGPVMMIGCWDYFELWDPWALLANPRTSEGLRFVVEGELEARGLPLERPA